MDVDLDVLGLAIRDHSKGKPSREHIDEGDLPEEAWREHEKQPATTTRWTRREREAKMWTPSTKSSNILARAMNLLEEQNRRGGIVQYIIQGLVALRLAATRSRQSREQTGRVPRGQLQG